MWGKSQQTIPSTHFTTIPFLYACWNSGSLRSTIFAAWNNSQWQWVRRAWEGAFLSALCIISWISSGIWNHIVWCNLKSDEKNSLKEGMQDGGQCAVLVLLGHTLTGCWSKCRSAMPLMRRIDWGLLHLRQESELQWLKEPLYQFQQDPE